MGSEMCIRDRFLAGTQDERWNLSACGMQRCDDIWNATGHHGNACGRRVDWNAAHCISAAVWSEWRPDRCRTSFSPVSSVSAMHVYRTGTDLQLFKKTVEEPFFFSRTDYRISSENAVMRGTLAGGDFSGSIL